MNFKKYNSIENSYQKEFLQNIVKQGFGDVDYIVQEKVHGANFSFITNGTDIQIAKRTGFIEEGEAFFFAEKVVEKYKENVFALYQKVAKVYEKVNTITIFGELFGGGYPHDDIEIEEESKLVQRGIYYCPNNEFFAFDILLNNEFFLSVNEINQLFEEFHFLYAKTLFQGSLTDCLNYPNEFKTTIPNYFNLPELEGNICEGTIIRPIEPLYFKTGSRVIIKNKNERWAENNSYIPKEKLSKVFREITGLSETAQFLSKESLRLINENRLINVVSKIGEITPQKDYGKLLGMFNKDVLEELKKMYSEQFSTLEKKEQKLISKNINTVAKKIVDEYLFQL